MADDDSSRDEDNMFYQDNDATTELAWQIRELTAMEEMDPTPRLEIAQRRPLGTITPFRGRLDESEDSMQWLRGFVYEMKGTHPPPNEWCMAFQLSLRDDKFISYYCSQFSQSASTRYYRAKRSEKEHIRDYLNRLSGYARSANIKFERSGRVAKDHVKHFLETCGDRDLERQLTPMQLRDIHTLEDIVSDIQKVEKRVSSRSSSQTKCRLCQQVHDFGKWEAFGELAKILRTNVDKKNISPELQKLVFADLVFDAECMYAFTEICEWPEDNNNNVENEKNAEFDGECGVCLDGGTLHEIKNDTTTTKVVNDDLLVGICEANEAAPVHAKTFGFWVMDHSAGSEVALGTDFMIPAGIRLDLFNATAKLPGEEMVPLVKSLSSDEDSAGGMHVTGGPTKTLQIPAGEWVEFRLQKRKPSLGTHDGWVRRTAALIPTITQFRKGQPTLVRLTNITDRVVYCPAHLNVIAWVPRGFMPKRPGYVPIDSRQYEQWQVLAYAGSHDETWFKLECELYERWLASQPPLVERQPYTWPTSILQNLDEYSSDGGDSLSQDDHWSMEPVDRSVASATDGSPMSDDSVSAAIALGASSPTPTESADVNQECNNFPTETHSEEKSPEAAVADLEHTFMCIMRVLSTEGNDDPADDDYAVHEANYMSLKDYAQELAFLPDLREPRSRS
ncbi:hypothetical protein PHMEG_00027912 [Phytophthora megakarya]|uniref:Retrotransposon gag domain-containing protein n=1 Tax=Phytophthora megakarya TaxID=4795 RepID=A0A225V7C9_9STRA|nr:hypothetical protein PHMEG_00027912 [Phytophthora megakarya]